MKLTKKTQYGITAMVHIAKVGEKVTIAEISEECDLPIKFLEQILLDLKRSKLLKSRRGASGGYMLEKKPEDISLYAIIRALKDTILDNPKTMDTNNVATELCFDLLLDFTAAAEMTTLFSMVTGENKELSNE